MTNTNAHIGAGMLPSTERNFYLVLWELILLAHALCIKCGSSLSWIRVYVFGDGRTKLVNFRAEHVICAIFERDCHDGAVRYEWVAAMLMRCVISQP